MPARIGKASYSIVTVAPGEGYTCDIKKDGNRIMSITWKQEIKPKEFKLYTFTAHNPQSGVLQWKAHQTFADGSVRHWVGERGTKEPASVTTIVPIRSPSSSRRMLRQALRSSSRLLPSQLTAPLHRQP